jgi:hypothetical protein
MICGLLILLALALPTGSHQKCGCRRVPVQEQTRWGNDNITLSTVARVRSLKGTITVGNDEPKPNALVEVFTDPDVILLPYSAARQERRQRQRRVAACFTNDSGKFCLQTFLLVVTSCVAVQALSRRRRKPLKSCVVDARKNKSWYGCRSRPNAAVEQIVGREPRKRVSHEAFANQSWRYRAAASTQPLCCFLSNRSGQ